MNWTVPLPTEPFTVIRVHYFDPPGDSELILLPDGQWWTPGAIAPTSAEILPLYITEFEVIARPNDPDFFQAEDPISAMVRRQAIKDVLERVRAWKHIDTGPEVDDLAAEYGVVLSA